MDDQALHETQCQVSLDSWTAGMQSLLKSLQPDGKEDCQVEAAHVAVPIPMAKLP